MNKIKKRFTLTTVILACLLLVTACTQNPATTTDSALPDSSPTATAPSITVDPNAKAYQPSTEVPQPVANYAFNENAQNYFVDAAKGSDDSGDGSIDKPFKTIAKAKAFIQPLLASMSSDIVINLRAGTYYLDETLEFSAADSGCNGFDVVYRSYDSEQAVISGGTQITGWTQADKSKNIWSAPANGVISRTFFVNGSRAQRARTALATVNEYTSGNEGTDASNILEGMLEHTNGFTSTDMKWSDFERQSDMEMVFVWGFHAPRVPIMEIVNQGNCVLFKTTDLAWSVLYDKREHAYGESFHPFNSLYFIENAYELMDEPGEWYLNRDADTIYYIPREGEDMTKAETYMGRLEHLVSGLGSKAETISNIRFDNLAFMHTTWAQGETEEGWVDIQAGFYKGAGPDTVSGIRPSSALEFKYVRNIDFIGCTFAHIGNAALDFSTSTQNVTIASNHIYDISNNGIMLGGHNDNLDYSPRTSQLSLIRSIDNLIIDNTIHNIGAEYYDACGIVRGYTYNTIVAYNTITDVPYTGMSIGWGWGHGKGDREQTETQFPDGMFSGNAILCNRVNNAMQLLADGGGIYTLGRQDNMLIAGNYITNIGEQGIYLDNGSGNITVRDNVILDVVRNFVVRGHDNTVVSNYIQEADYTDAIQPELGGVSSIDYTNCSDALRDSVIVGAGTRVPYKY